MRRPRALLAEELRVLNSYIVGTIPASIVKVRLTDRGLYRYHKYNNYIRWRKRELRRAA